MEAIESASVELARFRTVSEVADSALRLALRLTRSSVAFLALVDENGDDKRVFSMAADPADSMPRDEIEKMFDFLSNLGVDGHTISPGYEYDAAKKDMIKRLNKQPEDFFLTRTLTRQKFAKIVEWGQKYTLFGSPI